MSRKYYIVVDAGQPMEKLTETEYLSLFGDSTQKPYVLQLYRGHITLTDIPEELQSSVQAIVNNRIARWGEYKDQEINANEIYSMLESVL